MKLIEWFQNEEDPHGERLFELTQEKFASFIESSSKSVSTGSGKLQLISVLKSSGTSSSP